MSHSPVPWRAPYPYQEDGIVEMFDASGVHVCDVAFLRNADFIVKCVNAHDALVKALKAIVDNAEGGLEGDFAGYVAVDSNLIINASGVLEDVKLAGDS